VLHPDQVVLRQDQEAPVALVGAQADPVDAQVLVAEVGVSIRLVVEYVPSA